MQLSGNVTVTDILTLLLLVSSIGFYIYNIVRENIRTYETLQAKNYYFLSLILQLREKKLSRSFKKFIEQLKEDGKENFYLSLYPVVESNSIKNIDVSDLLKYYSSPPKGHKSSEWEVIQRSWFMCFEYLQQWENSQQDAMSEEADIHRTGKEIYAEFFQRYYEISDRLDKLCIEDFAIPELYNQYHQVRVKHIKHIEDRKLLPSMHWIITEYYSPIYEIMGSIWSNRFSEIRSLIFGSHKLYSDYRGFIAEKIRHFEKMIKNQQVYESHYENSVAILIQYSSEHSKGKSKEMFNKLSCRIS